MTPRRTLPLLGSLLAAALVAAPAHAAGTPVLSGSLAAGGSWTVTASHRMIGPLHGLCVDVDVTLADGFAPGTGTGCAAGSLKADHGVFAMESTSGSGDTTTSYMVAGVVSSRASVVKVVFEDGHHARTIPKAGPGGWRRELGMSVRYFALDALAVTTSQVARVSIYDRHGRRIGSDDDVQQ